MFTKLEEMFVGKLVQQLNKHGINLDEETIKRAIANSPHLIAQVEEILVSSDTDKVAKIKALLRAAAGVETTTPK